METKESKETELKELSDKELKNVSGGGDVCSDDIERICTTPNSIFDYSICKCISRRQGYYSEH